jgi:hypothetical protein
VGQGTFVAESIAHIRHATRPRDEFDLSMNLPPQPVEADLEGRLIRGIAAIQREVGFSAHLTTGSQEAAPRTDIVATRRAPGDRCAWRPARDLSGHSERAVQSAGRCQPGMSF